MRCNKLFFGICLICFFLAACVSKEEYEKLEAALFETQAANRARLEQKDIQIRELDSELKLSLDNREALQKEYVALKVNYDELEKTILQSNLDVRKKRIIEQEQIIKELGSTKREIEINLKEQIKNQQIKLEEMEGKLKVTFVDKILFDSGRVEININGKALLSKLAQTLKQKKDQNIIIQGHTDNVEIGPELRKIYPTNWELSAGRSAAVLRYLIENAGIAPVRCAACGYSFYKPVASNASEAGRKQNRRIEIILVPARES